MSVCTSLSLYLLYLWIIGAFKLSITVGWRNKALTWYVKDSRKSGIVFANLQDHFLQSFHWCDEDIYWRAPEWSCLAELLGLDDKEGCQRVSRLVIGTRFSCLFPMLRGINRLPSWMEARGSSLHMRHKGKYTRNKQELEQSMRASPINHLLISCPAAYPTVGQVQSFVHPALSV